MQAAMRLRQDYLGLPAGQKWGTQEGQLFLVRLQASAQRYGCAQVADALGVSPQAVHKLLKRSEVDSAVVLSAVADVRRVKNAWRIVCAWRGLKRQVRRSHASYHRMHEALMRALVEHPIERVAALADIPCEQLRTFLREPKEEDFDDELLLDLLSAYRQGSAAKARSKYRAMFLAQLAEAQRSPMLGIRDIASVLNVEVPCVRAWLQEGTGTPR